MYLLLACSALGLASPLVGAHRGQIQGEPENTIRAFNHAIAAGVDIIELDLRETADGQIVIMHDPSVRRTTDRSGRVIEMTVASIRQLDAGIKFGPEFKGERVPLLGEVLNLAKGRRIRLLLDIKDGARIDLAKVIDLARGHGVAGQIVIGVRRVFDLQIVKMIDPNIKTLGFVADRGEIDKFFENGADIVRVWSDWIVKDDGLVENLVRKRRPVWVLVGRSIPKSPIALRQLHDQLKCEPVEAIISDNPELLLKTDH